MSLIALVLLLGPQRIHLPKTSDQVGLSLTVAPGWKWTGKPDSAHFKFGDSDFDVTRDIGPRFAYDEAFGKLNKQPGMRAASSNGIDWRLTLKKSQSKKTGQWRGVVVANAYAYSGPMGAMLNCMGIARGPDVGARLAEMKAMVLSIRLDR